MTSEALAAAYRVRDRAQQWRRHLHSCPELGFAEHATALFVATQLAELGWAVTRGIGGTGVVGTLERRPAAGSSVPATSSGGWAGDAARGSRVRAVGLRADMDGLALAEAPGRPHGSINPGAMHACGHDGHMAMVLGAAAVLAEEGGFEGTVRVFFQPAEEHGRGAQAMLDAAVLQRFPVDAMFGLHNLPGLPVGQLNTRAGAIMASEDDFEIRITGRGGHSSRPHTVIDPLLVGAEVVVALQSVVARSVDPMESAVLSCTEFLTDGIRNAIPGEVVIRGDTRSFSPGVSSLLENRIREIAAGVCAAYGASCEVDYTREFWPTVNDPWCAQQAADAATRALGAESVVPDCAPILASEDFAAFARAVPACFSFIGNGTELGAGGDPLHSRSFDFNDDALSAGIAFYVQTVRSLLPMSWP